MGFREGFAISRLIGRMSVRNVSAADTTTRLEQQLDYIHGMFLPNPACETVRIYFNCIGLLVQYDNKIFTCS